MKLAISVPSGAHHRTLLLPLRRLFEQDRDIEKVTVITPAAKWHQEIFPDYSTKFEFTDQSHVQADLVVTTTTGLDPNDPAILQAAKDSNIPTLTFIESWDNVYKMERMAARQVVADHFIVWNTMMRDHLLRIFPNLTSDQISIIGAPRLDYFWHADKIPDRHQLFAYLGLDAETANHRKLIHVSTTELYPIDYVAKTIHRAVSSGQLTHPLQLYASVHPGGNLARHKRLEQYGAVVRYSFGRRDQAPHPDFLYNPTEEDLYLLASLFKHSDLLVNHSSTTAIESMIADVPIINVQYGKPFDFFRWRASPVFRDFKEHYADLVADGATTIVHNPRQLIDAINTALNHPDKNHSARAATLQKMITTTDGTASQKTFDTIKQFAL